MSMDKQGLARRALVLETPRLLLAALLPEDQAALYELYACPEVAEQLSRLPSPFTMERAQELVEAARAGLAQGHSYTLGIFGRQAASCAGVVALRLPTLDPGLDEQERAEAAGLGILGYSVHPRHWGQGYATEAARHMVRFAFAELGLDVEGVDLSGPMMERARRRVPGAVLHEGDMRTFRLARRFDAVVCLFSSIGYMRTPADVAAALSTMRDHLVDGGVLVVEPWFEPDRWHDGAVFAEGTEEGELAVARASRSWREGDVSVIEMHYALARPDRTWSFTEIHRMGLFSTEEQLFVFRRAGLEVEHDAEGLTGRGLFVAVRPAP